MTPNLVTYRLDLYDELYGNGQPLVVLHGAYGTIEAMGSTVFKRDGWYPEDLETMGAMSAEGFAGTPIHGASLKTSPKPQAWPTVVAKVRQLVTALTTSTCHSSEF
jgi:hypothetical protein